MRGPTNDLMITKAHSAAAAIQQALSTSFMLLRLAIPDFFLVLVSFCEDFAFDAGEVDLFFSDALETLDDMASDPVIRLVVDGADIQRTVFRFTL